MCGVTKLDRIRNENIIGTMKVIRISKRVGRSYLTCNEKRRRYYVDKTVMVMDVPGKRRKGRPKRRWLDSIKHDLIEKGLSGGR